MNKKNTKQLYKQKYPTVLPKEDFQLYTNWQINKYKKKNYFARKQNEYELRKKGLGYLIGDLPKKSELNAEHYQLIVKYRQLRKHNELKDQRKQIQATLRDLGLGAFCGDHIKQIKPSIKERILTSDAIVQFSNAASQEVLGFMDTEFTTMKHEILSIGCVLYHTKTKRIDTFYATCRPVYERKLSARCIEITNLTQKEINLSPRFKDILPDFIEFLQKHHATTLMTWGNSDALSIKTSCAFNQIGFQDRNYIISQMYDIQPIISILTDENRSQISLQDMKDLLHIEGAVVHHALNDAFDLKDVFLTFQDIHEKEATQL